jgi:hypothetical protein
LLALQSWGPHFYTVLGFGVGLFFGLVNFVVFTSGRRFMVLTDATSFLPWFHYPLAPPFQCDDGEEQIYIDHDTYLEL